MRTLTKTVSQVILIFEKTIKETCFYKLQYKSELSASQSSAWIDDSLLEGFPVIDYQLEQQMSIQITKSLERINMEIYLFLYVWQLLEIMRYCIEVIFLERKYAI